MNNTNCTQCGARLLKTAEVNLTCEHKWDGDGLPPVGIECFYKSEKVSIAAHIHSKNTSFAVWQGINSCGYSCECFSPIKSDRDKAIEAAYSVIMELPFSPTPSDILEAIYEAGLLRLPEEK